MSSKGKGKGKGKGKRSQSPGGNDKRRRVENGCHGQEGDVALHPRLHMPENKQRLKYCWSQSTKDVRIDEETLILQKPFKVCSLHSFMSPLDFIDELRAELNTLEFVEKSNDLYKFKQSRDDLQTVNTPAVRKFRRFLAEQVKPWLQEMTGIDLHETIDMFCARYEYTDYLLCHDDELEGRRIAYILYLVPPTWKKEDGGCLDLFDTDSNGQPDKVVQSLVPSSNGFAFFEVTPQSYHQVSEVLTKSKVRLSIGGWFHGTCPKRPPKYIEPKLSLEPAGDISEKEFYSWLNPIYLDIDNQEEIRETFEANSEISLANFLVEDKYEAVCSALLERTNSWKYRGPPNKRCYEVLSNEPPASIISQCLQFLKSDAMFLLLSSLTGLKLHHLAKVDEDSASDDDAKQQLPGTSSASASENAQRLTSSNPKCTSEIRRWHHGAYTLIHDDDNEQAEFALDARLFFNCREWQLEHGGYSSYVARNEDEELLTAQPSENTLILIYRDMDTLKFIKRVTNEITFMQRKEYHDMSLVYYE